MSKRGDYLFMRLYGKTMAKVNLFLAIGALRPDRYHELRTLFWPLPELSDDLTISDAGQLNLHCSNPDLPDGPNNLVYRAAQLYAQTTQIEPNWQIDLQKNIPCGAGLGGGSGDAAKILTLLNDFYGLLSPVKLAELAVKLGADVPFFLTGQPAFATGIGEILTPVKTTVTLPMAIIKPPFASATKTAYKSWEKYRQHRHAHPVEAAPLLAALSQNDFPAIAAGLFNDFDPVWRDKYPLYDLLSAGALSAGAAATLICGSGSAMLALGPDATTIQSVAQKWQSLLPNAAIFKLRGEL